MTFRFPLEAVLHFRKSVEHQQELRLRAANQLVAKLRNRIEQLSGRIAELRNRHAQELGRGTSAAEMRFVLECEAILEQQRQAAARELTRLEALRNQQQKIFQQARRERETFESLRDRQLRNYEREAARREQRRLDELFLIRQVLLRRMHPHETHLQTGPRRDLPAQDSSTRDSRPHG
jgi:flagellar export protein FliJ